MLRRYRIELILCFGFIVLVFLVFGRALQAELLPWDDDVNIYENVHIRGVTGENLHWMFTDFQQALRYKPLSWLSWAMIYEAGNLNPFYYHLANLLFHAGNTILLFLILRLTLRLMFPTPPASEQTGTVSISAGMGALFWALHPLRVEPVAWATGLPYGQSLFLTLLALFLYLLAQTPDAGVKRQRLLYWGAVAAYFLAVLTYPIVLGFFVVPVAVDFLIAKGHGLKLSTQIWLQKLPFALASAFVLLLTLYGRLWDSGHWGKPPTLAEFDLLSRVMQSFYVFAYYAWRPWFPVHLAPIYTQFIDFNPLSFPFVFSAILVLVVTFLLFRLRHRWPLGIALWGCHLALLAPMLGLTEHPHYPSDRYGLLVNLSWSVLIAAGLQLTWRNRLWRQCAVAISCLCVGLLGYLSFQQTGIWLNRFVFFESFLRHPGDDRNASYLHALVGLRYFVIHEYKPAEQHVRTALRLKPDQAVLDYALAQILCGEGKLPEALAETRAAVQKDRQFPNARLLAGEILLAMGKPGEAEGEFRADPELASTNPQARMELCIALAAQGKTEAALSSYEEAARLVTTGCPPQQHAVFFKTMAVAYERAGNPGMAAQMLQRALGAARAAADAALTQEIEQRLQQLALRTSTGK